jgi:hypothetical protein
MASYFTELWERFLKEGDELFNYMTNHFKDMFDGDIPKHFNIRFENVSDLGSIEVKEKYGNEIQNEFIPWIQKEFIDNQLFKKTFWKPFRDKYTFIDMYLGYRILFPFREYYFQLAIDSYCSIHNCIYCSNDIDSIHFELVLYGWKEDGSEMLQPDNDAIVYPDNIMPDLYWKMK